MKSFLNNNRALLALWIVLLVIVIIKLVGIGSGSNNYLIFKFTFVHAWEGHTLYGRSPLEFLDKNHYGPLFSLVMFPFAVLPDKIGLALWLTALFAVLWGAIRALPLSEWQKNVMALFIANELLTAGFNAQFNIAVAAMIVYTYVLIHRRQDFWASLPFLLATFIKLYGVVALAFFFFVKDKPRFMLGCVVWSIVLFLAPMAISSPQFVMQSYQEWFQALVVKNAANVSLVSYQDISVMGFFRRLFENPNIPNLPFLLGGAIIFALPYLRWRHFSHPNFQLRIVASTLIFPVLFSSASEGSTYIIVFTGLALWLVLQPTPWDKTVWTLVVLAIFFATLNSTDLYPRAWRDFLRLHSIKAIPCLLIWLRIMYELCVNDFSRATTPGADYKPVSGQR